ncbi:4-hydroxybenzoate polyprenyltransferase, mitochondrial-like [Hibiscus syriacus]|uniref:4-hydroxybenzoate polyprenyltransferase, mitochondrial-like n=1 Tax=Hibiscus syriacus TaxID=106335 RepID=UPI001920DD3F|nr:4-hydroxybenzoate polyprenyltransferase, mitochondrial-like [Hibiscus syriacus]
MASISVSGASLVSTHPTTRMLKHHPILNIPFANPSLFSRKIDWSTCRSSSYKTRVASMSTTTSPSPVGGKGDRKLINVRPNEDVVKVSPWVEYLPQEIQPYAKLARVEKPIGTWLLLFPSATLAASIGSLPDHKTLAVFACACPLLRGAACTINDFLDRYFEKLVERTKSRPMASGAVTPFTA